MGRLILNRWFLLSTKEWKIISHREIRASSKLRINPPALNFDSPMIYSPNANAHSGFGWILFSRTFHSSPAAPVTTFNATLVWQLHTTVAYSNLQSWVCYLFSTWMVQENSFYTWSYKYVNKPLLWCNSSKRIINVIKITYAT